MVFLLVRVPWIFLIDSQLKATFHLFIIVHEAYAVACFTKNAWRCILIFSEATRILHVKERQSFQAIGAIPCTSTTNQIKVIAGAPSK